MLLFVLNFLLLVLLELLDFLVLLDKIFFVKSIIDLFMFVLNFCLFSSGKDVK